MKQTKNKLWASAFLPFAFASSALTGQSAAEDVALDETVVVGNSLAADTVSSLGTPTAVLDVPQSLSITSADVIDERGFNSIGDIIDYTPGVNQSQGEGHRDAVVFRGVRSTADFFVDGVRDDVQYYRPLYNVEQVEILRGPNALFFGRGGAGGVLNRVSKKGVIGQDFNAYKFGVDSFGAAELQVDSNSALNEDVAVRINAYYERYANHRDYYDGDGYGVNPTVQFKLSDQTTLNASYEYLDHTRFIDRGIPTDPTTGEPVDALNGVFFGDKDLNESEFEAHVLRLDLAHSFSDETAAKVTLSYGDYDKAYGNYYANAYNSVNQTVELKGYIDTTDRSTLTLSNSLSHVFEVGSVEHALLLGAEYISTSNDNDRYKAVTSSNYSIANLANFSGSFDYTDLNDDTEADLDVVSVFIQDTISLSNSLDVILGGRFDRFDLSVNNVMTPAESGSQDDSHFSPRVGFVYKPQESVSLYASYSETFVPQSGEQYANLGKDALDADEFTNLEAGVKWNLHEGYELSCAIFQIDQDFAEDDGNGGSTFITTEITGFETQFVGQLSENWTLTAGYSFLDGEDKDGNRPKELPENMFSVWNYYQASEKLGLGLGAIYQDESIIKNDPSPVLPDYFRVDAAAYYAINEDLRLQLNIENLLDETYYPSAHSTHQATVGAPINARISISGRF
jgi:catecholate siderophore receptor